MGILLTVAVLINIVLVLVRKQIADRLSSKQKKYVFIALIAGILVLGIITLIILKNINL